MDRVQPGFLPGVVVRGLAKIGPDGIVKHFARAAKSLQTDRPVFIFRVDDYPRWDLDSALFPGFDDIFREFDVPYVLGVTPWCEFEEGVRHWITDIEADYLRELESQKRVELALHGFTHKQLSFRGEKTEIAAYNRSHLRERLDAAISWFSERKLATPCAFIPPFNSFTPANFEILRQYFEIVMSGPPALSSFGAFRPQVWEGTIYLPSYRPLVGLASDISKGLRIALSLSQLHAITIHWAWELRNGYRRLRDLVSQVGRDAEVWNLEQTMRTFDARKAAAP